MANDGSQVILVLLDVLLWGTIISIAVWQFRKAKKKHAKSED